MQLVIRLAPSLLAIPGCGALTAAKTAGAERVASVKVVCDLST